MRAGEGRAHAEEPRGDAGPGVDARIAPDPQPPAGARPPPALDLASGPGSEEFLLFSGCPVSVHLGNEF